MGSAKSLAARETTAIEAHLKEFFGPTASIERRMPTLAGPLRSRVPFFQAFEVAPTDDFGMWTYVSGGSITDGAHDAGHFIEFVVSARTRDLRMVDRLAMNSYYHCGPSENRLDLGHRVAVGEPWIDGATVDSILVSLPYPYGEELERVTWRGGHARILWLMPVTSSELLFAREFGNEALEDLFEREHVQYMDFSRRAVVSDDGRSSSLGVQRD